MPTIDNMSANGAWLPTATADTLPPVMLETDPRLSFQYQQDRLPSVITNTSHCPVYRFSDTLAYKPVCRRRETKLMTIAGDITFPVVSKVGVVDDISEQWYQKGAIIKLGYPLDVKTILPAERLSIAQHMAALVARLHERGIIHGDIKPENFVRRPKDACLRLVGFSYARMADDSDLGTWTSDVPSIEYSSPKRGQYRLSTVTDDKFSLAVSIWAVFAGEKPMLDLFNSNRGRKPDLTKITDDDMFCAAVDFLREGGLQVDCPGTLARRDTLGIDRTVSFPLSLFDADLDDDDENPDAAKTRPRFCPHCFQIALSHAEAPKIETPVPYHGGYYSKTTAHDEEAVGEYALQWLQGQELTPESQDMGGSFLKPTRMVESRTRTSGSKLPLQVNITAGREVEKPLWSAASSATIIAPRHNSGRDRSGTVVKTPLPAPSESDEGYGSIERGSGSNTSSPSRPLEHSFQRSMSHWSESSFGSYPEDDGEESDHRTDFEPDWSPWPQTPLPPGPLRLQASPSFESVALTDDRLSNQAIA